MHAKKKRKMTRTHRSKRQNESKGSDINESTHQSADGLNRSVEVNDTLVNAHLIAVEGIGSLRSGTQIKGCKYNNSKCN